MMAQPGWEFQDGFLPHATNEGPGAKFDDDLFSAALLFLDHPYEETDSDSHSTPEPPSPQEPVMFFNTMDGEFTGFEHTVGVSERPAKISRTTEARAAVKLEPEIFAVKQEVVPIENIAGISSLWEGAEQSFRRAAPRRVNKRKEEINVLRVQAEALQRRLEMLHQQPLASQHESDRSLGGVLAWQDIANQQHEQRKLSESENRRLKELTSEHRRVAKALKRIAARQINSKNLNPFRPSETQQPDTFEKYLMLDDPSISSTLLASLDQMLLQTDSMLSETTGRTLESERHGDSHMTVKLQDSRIVPFGVTKTAAAVWNYTLLNEAGKQQTWSAVTHGTFQSEFVAQVELGDFRGHAEGRLVVRIVEEPHRTVIVRHSLFHCLNSAQANRFLTVPMRHFLWIVVDRPPHLGDVSGHDSISRIRSCGVSMPRLDIGELNDPSREAAIEELLAMCTQIATHQSEHSYDVVDNMLLGGAPPAGGKGLPCQAAMKRNMTDKGLLCEPLDWDPSQCAQLCPTCPFMTLKAFESSTPGSINALSSTIHHRLR